MNPPEKKTPRWRLNTAPLLALALFSIPSVFHGQDGSALDLKTIENSLEGIKKKQATALVSQRNSIYQDFRAASSSNSSALSFYQNAMMNVAFQGQNNGQTQFHDWKMQSANKFKDPSFQNALRLHLLYIVITLERGNGVTVKNLLPELLDYTSQAADSGQSLKDPFMRKDITGSIFVDWYQIHDWVASAADWEMKPGDVDGIFNKTILPELRTEKDLRVLQYWDNKIDSETRSAALTKQTFEKDRFSQIRLPSLLWNRAQEQLAIGQKNNAIKAMFALINNNLGHPNAADWVAELEGIIKDQTTVLPSTSSIPVPGASVPAAVQQPPAAAASPVAPQPQ